MASRSASTSLEEDAGTAPRSTTIWPFSDQCWIKVLKANPVCSLQRPQSACKTCLCYYSVMKRPCQFTSSTGWQYLCSESLEGFSLVICDEEKQFARWPEVKNDLITGMYVSHNHKKQRCECVKSQVTFLKKISSKSVPSTIFCRADHV